LIIWETLFKYMPRDSVSVIVLGFDMASMFLKSPDVFIDRKD
jgi:hypothetical protein